LDDSCSKLDSTPHTAETKDENYFNSSSTNSEIEESFLIVVRRVIISLKISVFFMEEVAQESHTCQEEDYHKTDYNQSTLL
jgi:hypothetical protein